MKAAARAAFLLSKGDWRLETGNWRVGISGRRPVAGSWWLAVGAGLFLAWLLLFDGRGLPGAVTAVIEPIITDDLSQPRLDVALPPPRGGLTIRQGFAPRWDGLREIELVLTREGAIEARENGRFHLQLFDDADALIAEQSLPTRTLSHNQTYTFRFAPQPHSAGRRYVLQLSGSDDNPVSAWGYSLDMYERGALALDGGPLAATVPATIARELRFVTRTQLTLADAFMALGTILARDGPFMLLALAFLPLPGTFLLLLAEGIGRKKRGVNAAPWRSSRSLRLKNPFAWWGAAYASGVAAWPSLWLALTLAGGRWRGWSLWLLFAVGWLAVLFLWQGRRGTEARRGFIPVSLRLRPSAIILILLLALTLATRLLAVRDLSFPPWVDSSRHGLITAVMTTSGQLLDDYAPYLPVENPLYHYGFHALSASLALMTGQSLPRLLLFLGQLLNGLIPLTVYTAVILVTRQQRAALLAAFLVGLPFFFPGYYATWGRLTQLTAMFVMPVLLAFTWLLIQGGKGWRRTWWLVGLLAAGLFLVHVRVFLYFLPLAAVVWLVGKGRNGRWLAAAAGLALVLVSPRIWQLAAVIKPASLIGNPIPNYNDFPISYVQTGWEPAFLWLAAAAFLPLIIVGRRRRWSRLPLTLIGWTAVLFIWLAGDRWGLPSSSMINLNSMYITLFLPLAIYLGVIGDRWWRWWRRDGRRRWLGQIVAGGGLLALGLFGVRQQISILNPQTILAQPEDLTGLAWIDAHLPETAVIAINSWQWLGQTWAGSDGGAWIVPLTRRMSSTPPIDHIYNRSLFRSVRAFNEAATTVTDWSDPAQAAWLRQQGISHIFVGKRGGFFDPAALNRNPQMEIVYGRDGVFVFQLE